MRSVLVEVLQDMVTRGYKRGQRVEFREPVAKVLARLGQVRIIGSGMPPPAAALPPDPMPAPEPEAQPVAVVPVGPAAVEARAEVADDEPRSWRKRRR